MKDVEKREQVKQLVRAAAWDERKPCEHCDGEGSVPGGRQLIHSRAGGFGADWDLDAALAAIDSAEAVQWQRSIFGHALAVTTRDGRVISFAVQRPAEADVA